jgi:hypothetical protein
MLKFIKNTLFDIEGLLKDKAGTLPSNQDQAEDEDLEIVQQPESKVQVIEQVNIVDSKQPAKLFLSEPPTIDPENWLAKISKYWSKPILEQKSQNTGMNYHQQPTTSSLQSMSSPQQTISSLIEMQSAFTKEEVESIINSHASEWRRPWPNTNAK